MTAAAVEALAYVLASFFAATALSFVLTPPAIRFARRLRALGRPEPRRSRPRRTPRTGGLPLAGAFALVALGAVGVNDSMGQARRLHGVDPAVIAVLLGGVVVAALVGLLEERGQLSSRWRVPTVVGLGGLVVAAGVTVGGPAGPAGPAAPAAGAAWLVAAALTLVWLLALTRGVELADRLDGLGAGVATLAAIGAAAVALLGPAAQPLVALLCAVVAGSAAGILPWNFHPARIALGRGGVLVLGFALAVVSMVARAELPVALAVLGVPAVEMARTRLRTYRMRRHVATSGRVRPRPVGGVGSHRGAALRASGAAGALVLVGVLAAPFATSLGVSAALVVVAAAVAAVAGRRTPRLEAATYFDPGLRIAQAREAAVPWPVAQPAARRVAAETTVRAMRPARRVAERRSHRTDERQPQLVGRSGAQRRT